MKKIVATIAVLFLVVGLSACEEKKSRETSHDTGQALTEKAASGQSQVPYPADEVAKGTLELKNLKERLLRQLDSDKIGYVYFFPFGSDKPFGYWTISGKVSSTQSQMTPSDTIEYACNDGLSGCQAVVVQAPGDDLSYSENEKGVFFFTTEGAMVQVCETCYFYSDQPVNIGSIPELNGTETVENAGD